MDFAFSTYDNLASLKSWIQPANRKEDEKCLELFSEIKQEITDLLFPEELRNPKNLVTDTALLSEPRHDRD